MDSPLSVTVTFVLMQYNEHHKSLMMEFAIALIRPFGRWHIAMLQSLKESSTTNARVLLLLLGVVCDSPSALGQRPSCCANRMQGNRSIFH